MASNFFLRAPLFKFFHELKNLTGGSILEFERDEATDCVYSLDGFDQKVLLTAASALPMLQDEVTVPLGKLLATSYSLGNTHITLLGLDKDKLSKRQIDVLSKVQQLSHRLVNSSKISIYISDVYHFTETTDSDLPMPNKNDTGCPTDMLLMEMSFSEEAYPLCEYSDFNDDCCKLEEHLGNNKELVLRLMKYSLQAVSKEISELGEIRDLAEVSQIFDYKSSADHVGNFGALVSTCQYSGQSCNDLFDRFYTTDGIGYTLNHDSFWNIFQNNKQNNLFFREIHEKMYHQKVVKMIEGHGEAFSLEFYVRRSSIPHGRVGSLEAGTFMTIHSPFEIADFGGIVLEMDPGWTYVVYIYPSFTETDQGALSLDIEDRQCLAQGDYHNLKLFNHYTQAACLFECHIKLASGLCNCTPWDYIMYDLSLPLCNHIMAEECFEKKLGKVVNPVECECPSDCRRYNYDQSVTMQRTKPDRLCLGDMQKQR